MKMTEYRTAMTKEEMSAYHGSPQAARRLLT